jgi:hypothetical protein
VSAELALGLVFGLVIGVGRWREFQWRRSPLGQAQAAFERARSIRLRQRQALERLHAVEWAILAVFGLAFLAWAAAPFVSELVGAWRWPAH